MRTLGQLAVFGLLTWSLSLTLLAGLAIGRGERISYAQRPAGKAPAGDALLINRQGVVTMRAPGLGYVLRYLHEQGEAVIE